MTHPVQVTRWPPEILAGKPRRDKNPAGIELSCHQSFEMSAGMPRQDINWAGIEDLFFSFFLEVDIRSQRGIFGVKFLSGEFPDEKILSAGINSADHLEGVCNFFQFLNFKWP